MTLDAVIWPEPPAGGWGRRAWVALWAVAVLAPPNPDAALAAAFLALLLGLGFAGARAGRAVWWAPPAVALSLWAFTALAPLPRIDEGHNVFLHFGDGRDRVLAEALPPDVHAEMTRLFDKAWPPDAACAATADCWRDQGAPDAPFAASAEGLGRGATRGRLTRDLDFDSLAGARAGFANDKRYNWFGQPEGPQRAAMPWFSEFSLPPAALGGRLCARGFLFAEAGGKIIHNFLRQPTCLDLDGSQLTGRIWAVSILPQYPAMVRLEWPAPARLWLGLERGLRFAGLGLLALAALGWRPLPRLAGLAMPLGVTAAGLALAAWWLPFAPGDFPPFPGGNDGLTHESFAGTILAALARGDLAAALRGGADVYYYMPGLRYGRALERLIFGDSNIGMWLCLGLLPLAVWRLAGRMTGPRMAAAVAALFLATPLLGAFGLALAAHVASAAIGYGEPVAWTLFFLGLSGVLRGRDGDAAPFGALLLLALSVWLRPNLLPGAVAAAACPGLAALRARDWRRAGLLALAFSPVLGMLAHNLVFGGAFVPLTAAASIPENLPTPPGQWLAAAGGDGAARGAVTAQLAAWLVTPWRAVFLLALPLTALPGAPTRLRQCAAVAALLHLPLLFYTPELRYAVAAWAVTFLVALGLWCHVWPALRRHLPEIRLE